MSQEESIVTVTEVAGGRKKGSGHWGTVHGTGMQYVRYHLPMLSVDLYLGLM